MLSFSSSSHDALLFSVHIMTAAVVLVAALSVQDVIVKTLDLLPIPSDTIWWKWLIAVIRVIVAFMIVFLCSRMRWVKLEEYTN